MRTPGHGSIASMIKVRELIRDYGDKRAVNRLSFSTRPAVVTGFLDPSGSRKSTTMWINLRPGRPDVWHRASERAALRHH
jgi:ABC-type phosphonate transport system ATPase subunit